MSTGPGFIYRITDGDTGELLYLGYTDPKVTVDQAVTLLIGDES